MRSRKEPQNRFAMVCMIVDVKAERARERTLKYLVK